MDFEQVAPRRAERDDGTAVELADRHHAQLHGPLGTWLIDLGPSEDDDWFAITVFADSMLRAGGLPTMEERTTALDAIVEGLRALRIRVRVTSALDA